MDKYDQKEGFFQKLRDTEGKNKELLEEVRNQKTKDSDEKDSQITKAKNSLLYYSNRNFKKYRLAKNIVN